MKKIDPFLLTIIQHNKTGLPLDLYMEDCLIKWHRLHNPYKILVPNKYGKYYLKKCIWLSIDKEDPKVLSSKRIKIKKEDLQTIKLYIQKHYEDFVKHIELKEDDYILHLRLSKYQKRYQEEVKKHDTLYINTFNKEFSSACELTSKITYLPVNIWSIHNGYTSNKYYKPKIKIGIKDKYFIIAIIEKEPIIIYKTLNITTKEYKKCLIGLNYVIKNIDIFLKHNKDIQNNFNDTDLIKSLKDQKLQKTMIH